MVALLLLLLLRRLVAPRAAVDAVLGHVGPEGLVRLLVDALVVQALDRPVALHAEPVGRVDARGTRVDSRSERDEDGDGADRALFVRLVPPADDRQLLGKLHVPLADERDQVEGHVEPLLAPARTDGDLGLFERRDHVDEAIGAVARAAGRGEDRLVVHATDARFYARLSFRISHMFDLLDDFFFFQTRAEQHVHLGRTAKNIEKRSFRQKYECFETKRNETKLIIRT